ncbi:hypothetical protein DACRYDRAFT_13726 [Dacryopinax primogenitus]|uniref:Uncharacterized protein n=1 Tax=Dacryopinax primogenitus (strain DJM 731) TaxID=1858805 RepID=M5G6F7_DACPD|nr:uncharacterized protein DACRYDRAFT_13726 [Dacryopinax primogenitus]EJU05841.1 hypothetical protein DACRYDRAFT_13726 [Dacryopinax primogenitus]
MYPYSNMRSPPSSPTALEKTQAEFAAGLLPLIPVLIPLKPKKSKEFKSREVIEEDEDESEEEEELPDVQDINIDDDGDEEEEEETEEEEVADSSAPDLLVESPFPDLVEVTAAGPPEFSYQTISSNPNLQLFLIRLPPSIKPKYLENLELDLDVNDKGMLGSFQRKGETWEVRDASEASGAEEMQGLTVLLRDEEGKGTHRIGISLSHILCSFAHNIIAPRLISRNLVITRSLPSLSLPSTSTVSHTQTALSSQPPTDYTIASMRPPSMAPPERMTYRFAPPGTWEARTSLLDTLNAGETDGDVLMADAAPAAAPAKTPKNTKKHSAVDAASTSKTEPPTAEKPKKKRKSEVLADGAALPSTTTLSVESSNPTLGEKKKKRVDAPAVTVNADNVTAVPPPSDLTTAAATPELTEKKKKKRQKAVEETET